MNADELGRPLAMRVAVVGHIEWVTFVAVDRSPVPGSISHATATWDEPAGGGGVAAAELARLSGGCTLYTALGNDGAGTRSRELLSRLGVEVHAAIRDEPQRRAVTLIDPDGERSIVVLGDAQEPTGSDALPFEKLAMADAVYLCKGDAATVQAARRARVLVSTARILPVLRDARVQLDILVRSANDDGEAYNPGDLDPPPRAVVSTEGAAGGSYTLDTGEQGRFSASPLPGALRDAYGAGDCFAAALAFGLAEGLEWPAILNQASQRGALALCRRGAHGNR